jgi:hypothetical protein
MYKIIVLAKQVPDTRNVGKDAMKAYQKLADIFTPMTKGLSSEICNQVAYDSLQIPGGSGFMKDYLIERIYRDARITSIYEGTTQLQVVAAVRGVTTGGYLAKMRAYEQMEIKPELLGYRSHIVEMTNDYEYVAEKLMELDNNEYTDFHARRLVEMAGKLSWRICWCWMPIGITDIGNHSIYSSKLHRKKTQRNQSSSI